MNDMMSEMKCNEFDEMEERSNNEMYLNAVLFVFWLGNSWFASELLSAEMSRKRKFGFARMSFHFKPTSAQRLAWQPPFKNLPCYSLLIADANIEQPFSQSKRQRCPAC